MKKRIFVILLIFSLLAGCSRKPEAPSTADTSESAPVTIQPSASSPSTSAPATSAPATSAPTVEPTTAPTAAPTTAQPTAPSVQPTVPQPTEHTHHFVQTEAKAYTCTENGYTIEVCTDCGAKKTTTYYAPGHTPGYWTTDVEPTASTEGHAYQTCYVCGAVIAEKTIPVLTYTYHAYSQAVLDLVNAERAKEGLSPLALDPAAGSAAQVRARETVDLFEHVRPNGTQCFTALDEAGATYRMAGENIACGQPTPEAVVDAWMHSEGHRANIMKPEFTHMGLGCCELSNDPNRYYIYWAQLFITK